MAKDKSKSAKKIVDLLNHKKECECGGSCCNKTAAISNLGPVGSGFKPLRPSSISFRDISSKPMPQKQLGQKENNIFLNNYTLQQAIPGANINKQLP